MVFDNRANGRLSLGGLALAATLATVALPGLTWGYPGADNAETATRESSTAATSADAPPAPEGTPTTTVTVGEGLQTVVPVLSEIRGIQELFLVSQAGSADNVAQNGNQNADAVSGATAVLQDVAQFNAVKRVPAALKLVPAAEQTIKLQDGSTIEIRRTDDGNLVLTVNQNGQQPQAIQLGFDMLVNKVLTKSADTSEVMFAEPAQTTSREVLGDDLRTRIEVAQPVAVNTTQIVKDWDPNVLAGASDEDLAMLRSDVELAKVTLEEKQTEVENRQGRRVLGQQNATGRTGREARRHRAEALRGQAIGRHEAPGRKQKLA